MEISESPKVRLQTLLDRAEQEGFAVPAFNYSDIWDFLAIVEAAEELRAPVFVSSNQRVVSDIGLEICGSIGSAAMSKAGIPVFHHLDHSQDPDLCIAAVDHGYPSVMIDASMQPLEQNIRITRGVADYARPRGVMVEGEVGRILGTGAESETIDGDFLARVEDVVRFVEETLVDMVAVGIGTAHGFYRGKPQIHFDLLRDIKKEIDVPIVLHGGTGIPETDIHKAISRGINKINVGTIIHCTYMNALRAELIARGENAYTLDVMVPVRQAVKRVVQAWIKTCRAENRV